ncbi:hypothetical protein [Phascolarctobacterium succinatutens]|uniref:hypothetical protein n=1 Tax=Phascolarctobacterium succinatutens TaxID=626940 RepID=UPI003AF04359
MRKIRLQQLKKLRVMAERARCFYGCACSNIEASEYYAPYWKRDPRKSEKVALHTKASNSWYACLAMLDKIDECL